jgi:hypothetical protein
MFLGCADSSCAIADGVVPNRRAQAHIGQVGHEDRRAALRREDEALDILPSGCLPRLPVTVSQNLPRSAVPLCEETATRPFT